MTVVKFDEIGNFRDIGGHDAASGSRMRTGKVFRSGHLARASDRDLKLMEQLDIGLIIDLRDPWDLAVDGENRLPARATRRHIGYPGEAPSGDIQGMIHIGDPEVIERAFPPGAAYALLLESSATWSRDEGRHYQLAELLRCVIAADRAALIHCSAGKDRTGFASAVIQLSVGVAEETAIADYLSSNEARAVENAAFLTTLSAKGVLAELVEPLFVVREDYIRAFLKTVHHDWGGIDSYVRQALGLQQSEVDALRLRLLEPPNLSPTATNDKPDS